MRYSLLVVGIVLLPLASARAGSFDGTWSVLEVCDTTAEGARGYTWRFDAKVTDGHFVGQYRTKGQSPSMTLEGTLQPDGVANLAATGISGDSDHNLKFAAPQTPISYRVSAKFSGTSGTGDRMDARRCKFTFKKQ